MYREAATIGWQASPVFECKDMEQRKKHQKTGFRLIFVSIYMKPNFQKRQFSNFFG